MPANSLEYLKVDRGKLNFATVPFRKEKIMELVSYPALFTARDGQILVDFPDLPEAFTQGKTMAEAMEFAKLGLAITINDKLGHFEKAPKASALAEIAAAHPESVAKMVTVDLDQY